MTAGTSCLGRRNLKSRQDPARGRSFVSRSTLYSHYQISLLVHGRVSHVFDQDQRSPWTCPKQQIELVIVHTTPSVWLGIACDLAGIYPGAPGLRQYMSSRSLLAKAVTSWIEQGECRSCQVNIPSVVLPAPGGPCKRYLI